MAANFAKLPEVLRRIEAVDDESALPPIADELLRHSERRKGPAPDSCTAKKSPENLRLSALDVVPPVARITHEVGTDFKFEP
jgi:hypothetical protein